MCAKSDRTQDVNFFDFAVNYELQENLNLESRVFIKPSHNYLCKQKTPKKNCDLVARFLTAFKNDSNEQNAVYDLLMTNPVIRILTIKHD